jgi:hypothetical protein
LSRDFRVSAKKNPARALLGGRACPAVALAKEDG